MKRIEEWTIAELAAQCIMPRISADDYFADDTYRQQMHDLASRAVCGFCVFKGTAQQTQSMIYDLQVLAKIPLIFSADFEHGLKMRLSEGTDFPHAMAMAEAGSIEITERIAEAIAKEAKTLGIHWNFAPVCDINTNPENPIINIRAFGDNVDQVSIHSTAFIRGTQNVKVLACAKHFPGHGDTSTDSHLALPILNHSKDRIRSVELQPFVSAISAGVRSVMIGHLAVPSLDGSNTPASMSSKIIKDILREELQFKGLVVTDALEMKAIADNQNSAEAVINSLSAGADIALMPTDPFEAIEGLIARLNTDTNLKEQIIESVKRIIAEKKWCGLMSQYLGQNEEDISTTVQHEKLALSAAVRAIKIDDAHRLLPIKENIRVAGFAFVANDDIEPGTFLFRMLAQAIENDCDFGFVDTCIKDEDIAKLKEGIEGTDLLIFAFFNKPMAYKNNINVGKKFIELAESLAEGRDYIAILLGDPYMQKDLNAKAYLTAFSDSVPSLAAVVMKLSDRVITVD